MNSMSSYAFGIIIALATTTGIYGDEICSTRSDLGWKRDPLNCAVAYVCLLGRAVTYACSEGHVIGSSSRYCVPIGSALDDCTGMKIQKASRTLVVSRECKLGDVSPDEHNCAKYFECVAHPGDKNTMLGKECPYPMLYDVESGKCDVHSSVKCTDDMFVPKSPCDYDANKCSTAHCVPCNIRFPSCIGLKDGVNSWTGREWSPYYVVCKEERVTLQGECKSEKSMQVFHPDKRECVEFDEKEFVG